MARVLSFLITYFSNYYTLHRSDLAARAAPLDPRLTLTDTTIQIHITDSKQKLRSQWEYDCLYKGQLINHFTFHRSDIAI